MYIKMLYKKLIKLVFVGFKLYKYNLIILKNFFINFLVFYLVSLIKIFILHIKVIIYNTKNKILIIKF